MRKARDDHREGLAATPASVPLLLPQRETLAERVHGAGLDQSCASEIRQPPKAAVVTLF
jgi:hypothetical protein